MASLLRNAANAVLGWIVEAVVDLPFELATGWARKAAEKNSKAFEAADANSVHAWKHFPW